METNSYSPLVSNLIDFIKDNYSPQQKIKTSKNGVKSLFFRKSGKPLCYIETKDGKSTVTVVIGASPNEHVQSANISKRAKEMFTKTKQFHDGKWLFFDIRTKVDLEDIKSLLAIKRAPANKKICFA